MVAVMGIAAIALFLALIGAVLGVCFCIVCGMWGGE